MTQHLGNWLRRFAKDGDLPEHDFSAPDAVTPTSQHDYDPAVYYAPRQQVTWNGIPIMIENPRGTSRSGIGEDGQPWRTPMHDDYGFVPMSDGGDGEGVDVFLGDDDTAEFIFVVHQLDGDGEFDEYKCMLGYSNEDAARGAYLRNYDSSWDAASRIGQIDGLTREEFVKKHAPWILKEKQAMKNVAGFVGRTVRGETPDKVDRVFLSVRKKLEGAKRDTELALKSLDKYEKNPERLAPQLKNVTDLTRSAFIALRATLRTLGENVKGASVRIAYTRNVLDFIFKSSDLAYNLSNADEQTQDLGQEVYNKLRTKLKLSDGEAEAVGRLMDIATRGKNWDPALIRNNVFKAAHSLKMKLPSMSF